MGELGLQGISPRKFRPTTNSDHEHPIAENVLARNFEASGPNEKWTTNITNIWTAGVGSLLGPRDGSVFTTNRWLGYSGSPGDESLSQCPCEGTRAQSERQISSLRRFRISATKVKPNRGRPRTQDRGSHLKFQFAKRCKAALEIRDETSSGLLGRSLPRWDSHDPTP
jgi:transposase InsO family protein